jgi:hypothetical protein
MQVSVKDRRYVSETEDDRREPRTYASGKARQQPLDVVCGDKIDLCTYAHNARLLQVELQPLN